MKKWFGTSNGRPTTSKSSIGSATGKEELFTENSSSPETLFGGIYLLRYKNSGGNIA